MVTLLEAKKKDRILGSGSSDTDLVPILLENETDNFILIWRESTVNLHLWVEVLYSLLVDHIEV